MLWSCAEVTVLSFRITALDSRQKDVTLLGKLELNIRASFCLSSYFEGNSKEKVHIYTLAALIAIQENKETVGEKSNFYSKWRTDQSTRY